MGKRFVPTRDADQRALNLHFAIREIEQMPLVDIRVEKEGKEPICISDRNNPSTYWTYSVEGLLSIDIEAAKANGSTWLALRTSRKKPPRPRIPQSEVDRGVEQFFAGEDSE